MHRRNVALATLSRYDSSHAADRDRASSKALLGEPFNDDVERHAMAAHDDDVRCLRASADQCYFLGDACVETGTERIDRHEAVGLGE